MKGDIIIQFSLLLSFKEDVFLNRPPDGALWHTSRSAGLSVIVVIPSTDVVTFSFTGKQPTLGGYMWWGIPVLRRYKGLVDFFYPDQMLILCLRPDAVGECELYFSHLLQVRNRS